MSILARFAADYEIRAAAASEARPAPPAAPGVQKRREAHAKLCAETGEQAPPYKCFASGTRRAFAESIAMQPGPMSHRPAFDPDTIAAMGAAFDDLCGAFAADRYDLASRLIARRIIELARDGEHDRARLCRATFTYFGFDDSSRQAPP
jgi:hypothetical protein